MANQSGSHGANIIADLSNFESFQRTMGSALTRQFRATGADIEAAYQSRVLNSPQVSDIQVSVSVYCDIRSIDTQADPNNLTASSTMANQSSSHGANIIADLGSFESFQRTMRSALNRQFREAVADIEAAYESRVLNSPQAPGIQISVNVYHDIRSIDIQADLDNPTARLSQTDMNQDMAGLNLNIGESVSEGETGQRVAEDHRGGEPVPQATARVDLAVDGHVGGIDRTATTHNPAEEARPSLQSLIAEATARAINRTTTTHNPAEEAPPSLQTSIRDLLLAFDVANREYAEVHECPICHETFPEVTGEGDEAIVLDCNHVFGLQCMQRWICGGNNSCPLCRAAVLRPAVLAELADQEELYGRPLPRFRTAVPYVERNDLQARTQPHRQQGVPTELAHQERLPLGTSRPTARDQSFWEILASDREVSEEEVRSIPRVQAHLQEMREIGERLRVQANRFVVSGEEVRSIRSVHFPEMSDYFPEMREFEERSRA